MIDYEREREVIRLLKIEPRKWLFGLDDQADIFLHALFTQIPYTDKLGRIKRFGQTHIVLMGGTGVGKTDLINAHAMAIDGISGRFQGRPDSLPGDITGQEVLMESLSGRKIVFMPGPIFSHLFLVDEGNRINPRTQAAFLEPMEEKSITLPSVQEGLKGEMRLPLFPVSGRIADIDGPRFFMVFFTQNIFGEEEGTYPTPIATLDRFALNMRLLDPEDEKDEARISAENVVGKKVEKVTNLSEILEIGEHIAAKVEFSLHARQYMVRLIRNTRPHRVKGGMELVRFVKEHVQVGDSPRANFHLEAVAKTQAFFAFMEKGNAAKDKRIIVSPDDIKSVAEMVLAHRLVLKEGIEFQYSSVDEARREVLKEILRLSEVPPWT